MDKEASTPKNFKQLRLFFSSIRFRIAVLYSLTIFTILSFVVSAIYWLVSRSLDDNLTGQTPLISFGDEEVTSEALYIGRLEQIDDLANEKALQTLQDYTLISLLAFFAVSMVVGWIVSGKILKPIRKITSVAQEIQMSQDLKQRINHVGPKDELKNLADVFDEMLESLDSAFAQKVAALEANRNFVRESSHEIRNPLQIIRTNLQITLSDKDATLEDCREIMEVVSKAIDRMSKVINDLTQSENYRVRENNGYSVCDLSSMVAELAAEFSKPAEAKGIELKSNGQKVEIKGDGVALKQAVENLLINAMESLGDSNNGTQKPCICLTSTLVNGTAFLSVEDNGPGIQPEDHGRIFARNKRGQGKDQEGRGLGLTIVRQVAEAHGGRVEMESEPGERTVFSILLPSQQSKVS